MDDAMLNHAVFSKNRDRLLTSAVAQRFFAQVNQHAKRFMSDEHFAVDGTLKRIRRNFTLPAPAREILGNMNSISVLILFFSLWPFSGGKTYHMTADGSVPAASGIVNVHKGGANRNTELDIKVSNLARPANLASPGNVYIVWIRPNGEAPASQGALRVNKNLDGELKAATTSKDCEIFITPEQSATATAPTGTQVLHTHITLE